MDVHLIDSFDLQRDPASSALDATGRLRVLPAAFWQQFSQAEVATFCVRAGVYCVPTMELVEWLRDRIAQRRAIEIGAGNGVLAEALGIPATDNRMQEWPVVMRHYVEVQQAVVTYGPNIEDLNANQAVEQHDPEVVVAAWVTHRFNRHAAYREGNQWGVKEERIIAVAEYIHVGNRHVHRNKPIMDRPHEEFEFPWLVSRAMNSTPNFIAVWKHENHA